MLVNDIMILYNAQIIK